MAVAERVQGGILRRQDQDLSAQKPPLSILRRTWHVLWERGRMRTWKGTRGAMCTSKPERRVCGKEKTHGICILPFSFPSFLIFRKRSFKDLKVVVKRESWRIPALICEKPQTKGTPGKMCSAWFGICYLSRHHTGNTR